MCVRFRLLGLLRLLRVRAGLLLFFIVSGLVSDIRGNNARRTRRGIVSFWVVSFWTISLRGVVLVVVFVITVVVAVSIGGVVVSVVFFVVAVVRVRVIVVGLSVESGIDGLRLPSIGSCSGLGGLCSRKIVLHGVRHNRCLWNRSRARRSGCRCRSWSGSRGRCGDRCRICTTCRIWCTCRAGTTCTTSSAGDACKMPSKASRLSEQQRLTLISQRDGLHIARRMRPLTAQT